MSTGAILQINAKSEFNDLLFTNDIKMSEFKSSYKKITNFAEMPFSIMPTGAVTWGDKVVFKINKFGDMMTNMYLALELPEIKVSDIIGKSESDVTSNYRVKWVDNIGHAIIERAKLRIGGNTIQDMTGEFMMCHSDLYDNTWCMNKMMGHAGDLIYPQLKIVKQYIYIPLRFFNFDDYSMAIPINALTHHEIEVEIKLRNWEEVYLVIQQLTDIKDPSSIYIDPVSYTYAHTYEKLPLKQFNNFRLDCNFVFLDETERKYYIDNKQEILITQVQEIHQRCNNIDSVYLIYNNPIKEIYFLLSKDSIRNLGELFNYSGKPKYIPFDNSGGEITQFTKELWVQIPEKHFLADASLIIDGVDRVPTRDYKYWYLVQNYETFKSKPEHYIYLYSFGLDWKKNKGSCNFNNFDNVKLNIKLEESDIRRFSYVDPSYIINVGPENQINISSYGVSYNVLIIEDGMCELMYGM